MKSVRERMDINAAYREVGTYRGAAEICGTTAKTVKRAVLADAESVADTGSVSHNDAVRDLVAARVAKTSGRISAKRNLSYVKTSFSALIGGRDETLRRRRRDSGVVVGVACWAVRGVTRRRSRR